jgi:hypothetical protein
MERNETEQVQVDFSMGIEVVMVKGCALQEFTLIFSLLGQALSVVRAATSSRKVLQVEGRSTTQKA